MKFIGTRSFKMKENFQMADELENGGRRNSNITQKLQGKGGTGVMERIQRGLETGYAGI
jgi:hypothetical protein